MKRFKSNFITALYLLLGIFVMATYSCTNDDDVVTPPVDPGESATELLAVKT